METQFKILIVDDKEANRTLLQDHVRILNHTPLLAENGLVALKMIETDQPDLILLDIMMPGMSGDKVLEWVKAHAGHIPVIMISALDDMDSVIKCLQLGALDYLPKPFNPHILAARIKNGLAAKALHDMQESYQNHLEDYNSRLEKRVQARTLELHDSRRDIIVRLGKAAEYRDNETGLHVIRMSRSCHLLAQKIGLPECELILQASPMHDVGKIGIPDRILLKPGKLDHAEWQIMKTHATIGGEILSGSSSEILILAETIARAHHEKFDGSGYPKGLKGEEIPLVGRIVALCDVFDALTSVRPYKKAWSVEEAMTLIDNESGKHFDPKLVPAFYECLPEILKIKESFSD